MSESGAYAYPVQALNLRELVNDIIDGVPDLVSYCPLCASGVTYSWEVKGSVLVFGNTSGFYQSDQVMFDLQTGSYGRASASPAPTCVGVRRRSGGTTLSSCGAGYKFDR